MADNNANTKSCSFNLGLVALVFENDDKAKLYQAARARQLFALTSVLIKHDFAPYPAETKADVFWLLADLNAEFAVISGFNKRGVTGTPCLGCPKPRNRG
jgi:hypothetical protein